MSAEYNEADGRELLKWVSEALPVLTLVADTTYPHLFRIRYPDGWRWRKEPTRFIEQMLCNPETGKPFVLLPAERVFLAEASLQDQ